MARLTFSIEWEPAEGVAHPGLAATWARIEIHVDGQCVTTVQDARAGATRSGVYGPAMLVAEWIVRNYWFLLYECAPPASRGPAWRRRHSLAAGREGMSFPDLVFFRDERVVVAEWTATARPHDLPVRFIDSGREDLDPGDVRRALAAAVDAVMEQIRMVKHPDVEALREDWNTIQEMSADEVLISSRAARLGVDALDAAEFTDSLESCLHGDLAELPEVTGNDVLDAQIRDPQSLASAVATVRELVVNGGSPALRAGTRDIGVPVKWGPRPHHVGYLAARKLREKHGVPDRIVDLDALFGDLGLQNARRVHDGFAAHARQLQGLVGASPVGSPQMFVARRSSARYDRFLQARGLFAIAAGASKDAPRALTSAGTRLQVASRAFAAELLAPADLLRVRIAEGLDDDWMEALANEFDVATDVIRYQAQNHDLFSDT